MNSPRRANTLPDRTGGEPVFALWLPPVLTAVAILTYFLTRNSPKFFWAFNLWDYLYPPLPQTLMALMVIFSLPPVLQFVAGRVEKIGWRGFDFGTMKVGRFLRGGLVVSCVFAILWVFSERRMTGDSQMLEMFAGLGVPFIIKEAGGSFLFFAALRLAELFGVEYFYMLRMFVCASGVIFFVFLWKLVHLVFESRPERLLAFAFLAVPGYARIFFGHIEVYGFLLAAVCAYLYFGALYLEGKVGVFAPAFSLGVAFWMHLSAVFLVPSLLYLTFQRATRSEGGGRRIWLLVKVALYSSLPFLVFFLVMAAAGHLPRIVKNLSELLRYFETVAKPTTIPVIIPFFKSNTFNIDGRILNQYHFLSKNHLLFLLNANFILSPVGLLTAMGLIFAYVKKKGLSDSRMKFILTASLFMAAYSLIIYPLYWFGDWDLFSVTAFCYTLLAAILLFRYFDNRKIIAYLAIYSISVTLLFNSLPFILLSSMNRVKEGGLFSINTDSFEVILNTLGNPDTMGK